MFAGSTASASFYDHRITQDMVDGYVLHEITVENGVVTIHNFETHYSAYCVPTHTCVDCGFEMSGYSASHDYTVTEIRPEGQDTAQVVSYLCSNCGGNSLERAHAALLLLTLEGQIAENEVPAFLEAAKLDELCSESKIEADAEQQENQNVVRQIRIDLLHNRQQRSG